ncbi:MAG: hypothetical protein KAW00_06845 [Dehalococcoidia bacterium]|nr:hypothetical protein [Dehalococcoidia bacterium]
MSPPLSDEVKYVPKESICRMFNESQYPLMIAKGQLMPQFLRNDHLKKPEEKKEPDCTRSQMIRYSDKAGHWAVEVHQYFRADKTIGGSGRPDPKRLRIGNTVFAVDIPAHS